LQITCQFYRTDIRGNPHQQQNINKNKILDRDPNREPERDFNDKQEDPVKLLGHEENNEDYPEEGYFDSQHMKGGKRSQEEIDFDEILILFLNVTSLKTV